VPLGPRHIVRNLVLFASAAVGLVSVAVGNWPPNPAGTVIAIAVGGVLGLLAVTADDIVDLLRPAAPASAPRKPRP
jgi:hypothetical protein